MKSVFPRGKKICAVFIAASLCVSCVTTDSAREQFEPIRYTQEDVRRAEIDRISAMIQKEPVKALWRALLLRDAVRDMADDSIISEAAELLDGAGGAVTDAYTKALDEKKYYEAYRLLSALEAAGVPASDRNTGAGMFLLAAKKHTRACHAAKPRRRPHVNLD